MTTYYISELNGDDGNDGLSVINAIQTIEQLQTLIGSGDVTYFEAGVYRAFEITFTAAGADANNRIKWIGDVKGEYFSTKGTAMISGGRATGIGSKIRSGSADYAIRIEGNYYHFEMLSFEVAGEDGGHMLYIDNTYGHYFYRCRFHPVTLDYAIQINYDSYTTDVEDYTIFDSCVKYAGGFWFVLPDHSTELDSKIVFVNCLDLGLAGVGNVKGLFGVTAFGTDTYNMGGVRCYHNTVVGDNYQTSSANDSVNCEFYNNLKISGGSGSGVTLPTVAAGRGNFNVMGGRTSNSFSDKDSEWENWGTSGGFGLVGGVTDMDYYRKFGSSPYQPWELYSNDYIEMFPISAGFIIPYGNPTHDIYGVRRGNSPKTWLYAEIGGTGGTDPDGAWINDQNAFDFVFTATNDPASASSDTFGSVSANYIEGVGVPFLMANQGVIHEVKVLLIAKNVGDPPVSSRDMGYRVTTASAAETLATGTVTLDVGADDLFDLHEVDLTPPAAGWDWTNIAGLEGRVWVAEDIGGDPDIGFHAMVIRYQVSGGNTPGAVQSYQRPIRDAGELYSGNATSVLTGAGMQQILLPCPAATGYTITIPYKYDANYTGTLPTVDVIGMVGDTDKSSVAVGSVGTWNTDLTVEILLEEEGFVAVRAYSLDTSGIGKCWFGGLSIEQSPS